MLNYANSGTARPRTGTEWYVRLRLSTVASQLDYAEERQATNGIFSDSERR